MLWFGCSWIAHGGEVLASWRKQAQQLTSQPCSHPPPRPGGNEYGQCLPHGDKDVLRPVRCLSGVRVKQVAAGGMHSLALTEEGQVGGVCRQQPGIGGKGNCMRS